MLDPTLTRSYMDNFYGYGSWTAKLWFIGMEEGGGDSLDEIERRLSSWNGEDLVDLREFHRKFSEERWFRDRPPIQSTWGKLIRIALCAEGRDCNTEAVRHYQRDELGRRDGSTALIELFPLPSPSTKHWTYRDCGIPGIHTRELYYDLLTDSRIEAIRSRIDQCLPRGVVFYGLAYRRHWERIAGMTFVDIPGTRAAVAQRGATLLVLAPHPVAKGLRNADFCAIGELFARRIA